MHFVLRFVLFFFNFKHFVNTACLKILSWEGFLEHLLPGCYKLTLQPDRLFEPQLDYFLVMEFLAVKVFVPQFPHL